MIQPEASFGNPITPDEPSGRPWYSRPAAMVAGFALVVTGAGCSSGQPEILASPSPVSTSTPEAPPETKSPERSDERIEKLTQLVLERVQLSESLIENKKDIGWTAMGGEAINNTVHQRTVQPEYYTDNYELKFETEYSVSIDNNPINTGGKNMFVVSAFHKEFNPLLPENTEMPMNVSKISRIAVYYTLPEELANRDWFTYGVTSTEELMALKDKTTGIHMIRVIPPEKPRETTWDTEYKLEPSDPELGKVLSIAEDAAKDFVDPHDAIKYIENKYGN